MAAYFRDTPPPGWEPEPGLPIVSTPLNEAMERDPSLAIELGKLFNPANTIDRNDLLYMREHMQVEFRPYRPKLNPPQSSPRTSSPRRQCTTPIRKDWPGRIPIRKNTHSKNSTAMRSIQKVSSDKSDALRNCCISTPLSEPVPFAAPCADTSCCTDVCVPAVDTVHFCCPCGLSQAPGETSGHTGLDRSSLAETQDDIASVICTTQSPVNEPQSGLTLSQRAQRLVCGRFTL